MNVRLFLVQTFIAGIYSGIYGVVFNLYVLHMGFDTGFLGLLLSISLLASALASIPAGMLCDRYNHKAILVIFGLLSLLAILPLFLSSSPVVLLLASAVSGIFGQITLVCATPFLTENCEKGGMTHVFSASSALAWGASVIGYLRGGRPALPVAGPAHFRRQVPAHDAGLDGAAARRLDHAAVPQGEQARPATAESAGRPSI